MLPPKGLCGNVEQRIQWARSRADVAARTASDTHEVLSPYEGHSGRGAAPGFQPLSDQPPSLRTEADEFVPLQIDLSLIHCSQD